VFPAISVSPTTSSEKSSNVYSTELITKILKEEGHELFDARFAALGHTLQGGVPSPLDRTRAARLSHKCMQFLEQHANPRAHVHAKRVVEPNPESAATITIQGSRIVFSTIDEMMKAADMKNRRGKKTWWADLKALAEMMGGRAGLVHEDE
jgi:6-phosphofructokinase 1